MKRLLLGLLCIPISAMEIKDIEEGHGVGTLSVETTTHITYTVPDLENDHVAHIIQTYFPGSNGHVSRNVCPLLKDKLNRSSANCFEDEERLKKILGETIDEIFERKDKELEEKNKIISDNEVRIARINRNKKIVLGIVTGCTAIATCLITATVTLVPSQTICNE